MGEKDITEKILLTYNDVFADIVNVLLFDGDQLVRPEDLEDQSPYNAYKADGKIRDIDRDVAKRWIRNRIRMACFGFENQSGIDRDEVIRIYGYDGAEYRSQLLRENKDNPRYPVVTMVLYFGYKQHWTAPVYLHDALEIPERLKPFVPNVKINLFEIAYMSPEQVKSFRSDFRIVADYFVQKRINSDYVPPKDELVHVEAVLQLLSVMTNDRRFEDSFNEARTAGKEVRNMCDVLDRVEMRGREEGREEGLEIGREEGLEKGADRAFALMQMLFADGRSDDAVRAANDKEYARQLMKEYKLV